MSLNIAIIIFALSGMIVAITPFLHSINRDRIFKANFYEEDFNYDLSVRIKRWLDVLFISNSILAAISILYCLFYITIIM